MKLSTPKKIKKARIEIIPLIDIMFFLLATFVLVSFSMVENRGLFVDLPSSKGSDAKPESNSTDIHKLDISIGVSGTFAINKEEVSSQRLQERLRDIAGKTPDKVQIRILADKNSDLEKTVEVMDIARSLDITQILLRTKTSK